MKRSFLALLGVFAAVFLVLTVLKFLPSGKDSSSQPTLGESQRQRTISFWDAYRQATQLRTQGRFSQAIEAYRAALEIDPRHEESLYYIGNCYLETGEYATALGYFQQVTQLNPASHRGHSQVGVIQSTMAPGAPTDFEAARESLLRCIEINQEESGPFLRLGMMELKRGQMAEAYEHFKIAADFRSPEGLFLMGAVLFQQGRFAEARRAFRRVLDLALQEHAVSQRGVLSEGDVKPVESAGALTPLEAATVQSLVHFYWCSVRLADTQALQTLPPRYQIKPPETPAAFEEFSNEKGLDRDQPGRAAWGDYDRDGKIDLALAHPTRTVLLYRQAGNRFEERTASAGLGRPGSAWDLVWGDYDGDGWLDLYVIGSGPVGKAPNRLFRNMGVNERGEQRFADVTEVAGLGGQRSTARAVFLDYDLDGRLDILEAGSPDAGNTPLRLFKNQSVGGFKGVGASAGLNIDGAVVDVVVGDFNRDGRADIFVVRWKRPAILFENGLSGVFQDTTTAAGLATPGYPSLSAVQLDYNRDGHPDLYLSGYSTYAQALRSLVDPGSNPLDAPGRLFRNNGQGQFDDVSADVGLQREQTSMQAIATDVDADGWTDLVLANGGFELHRISPSRVLRNEQGRRFVDYVFLPEFSKPVNSAGAAAVDLNGDGPMEIYLSGAGLFRIKPQ